MRYIQSTRHKILSLTWIYAILNINLSCVFFPFPGEVPSDDTANAANSSPFHKTNTQSTTAVSTTLTASTALSTALGAHKTKTKRKSTLINSHIDKMLSDRMSLAENKKFCDNSIMATATNNGSSAAATAASLFYDKIKSGETTMDFLKHTANGDVLNAVNNNNNISNNNSIKSERLSPPQQNQHNGDAQSSNSRWVLHLILADGAFGAHPVFVFFSLSFFVFHLRWP